MDDLYPPSPCRDHGPDDCPYCEPPRRDEDEPDGTY